MLVFISRIHPLNNSTGPRKLREERPKYNNETQDRGLSFTKEVGEGEEAVAEEGEAAERNDNWVYGFISVQVT